MNESRSAATRTWMLGVEMERGVEKQGPRAEVVKEMITFFPR